jgi:hypothetical protein
MKRKDYKEVSPEPKGYGGATIPMIVARAHGRPPEGKTMICIIGKRCPRRKLPKAPTAAAMMATTAAPSTAETLAMKTLSGCIRCVAACRHSISELYASVDECFQAMEAMRQRMADLERVVEDGYKLLNRNVQKLFSMVGNMRGKWCNSYGKYH